MRKKSDAAIALSMMSDEELSGMTLIEISQSVGFAVSTVWSYMKRRGIRAKRKEYNGVHYNVKYYPYVAVLRGMTDEEIVSETVLEISKRLGCSRERVYLELRRRGLVGKSKRLTEKNCIKIAG
jgi:hypothetical protein